MGSWLQEHAGLIGIIVASVAGLNIVMVALAKALEGIKDLTETKLDDKISKWLHKISSVLSKVVEFISANTLPKK